MNTTVETMYTPAQAARMLHLSPARLRELSALGQITASGRTPGGHRRYSERDIESARCRLEPDAGCDAHAVAGSQTATQAMLELVEIAGRRDGPHALLVEQTAAERVAALDLSARSQLACLIEGSLEDLARQAGQLDERLRDELLRDMRVRWYHVAFYTALVASVPAFFAFLGAHGPVHALLQCVGTLALFASLIYATMRLAYTQVESSARKGDFQSLWAQASVMDYRNLRELVARRNEIRAEREVIAWIGHIAERAS
jgi:DNA-binding transcriptional MerR regulator